MKQKVKPVSELSQDLVEEIVEVVRHDNTTGDNSRKVIYDLVKRLRQYNDHKDVWRMVKCAMDQIGVTPYTANWHGEDCGFSKDYETQFYFQSPQYCSLVCKDESTEDVNIVGLGDGIYGLQITDWAGRKYGVA
jgi:hypothetical protein